MDPAISQLVMLAVVAVFGYFVLIRPQRQQRQRQQALLSSLQAGDSIVTIGGFKATVIAVDGDDVHLELGPGAQATVIKAAIARKVVDLDAEAAVVADPVVDEQTTTARDRDRDGASAAGE
jgi:preprotein translocase subunit YajC